MAAQNMIIAATSLEIGFCFIGRAETTFTTGIGAVIWNDWQIAENLKPFCHILLGYPAGIPPQPKQIKENRVFFVNQDQ